MTSPAFSPRDPAPALPPQASAASESGLPPALWLLAVGTFAVGTDAYVMAGVLPDLSRDLHLPISLAGQSVTVFALSYALLAPVTASVTGAWPRRAVLIAALAIFTAGELLAALAPDFATLLAGRVVSALGAASFTPQAVTTASSLVAPHHRARALAVVITGLTIATVLGVPLGTMLAGTLGWRATVATVAVLGAVALAGTVVWLPQVAGPGRQTLAKYLSGLREPAVVWVLIVSLLTATAEQVVYTYVGPVLDTVTNKHANTLPVLLLVLGIGAVVGNSIAGVATQRLGSRATLLLAVVGMTVVLALMPWWSRMLPAATVAMFVWGITGWMYVVPQQHRLLTLSRADGALAVALNNSFLYLGITLGGAIGGIVLTVSSPQWLAAPATLLGALAVTIAVLTYRPELNRPNSGASTR